MGVVGVQPATGTDAGCRERNPQRVGEIPHRRNHQNLRREQKQLKKQLSISRLAV